MDGKTERVVAAVTGKMRIGARALPGKQENIGRAQLHGPLRVLDSRLRLAEIDPDPAV